MTVMHDSGSFLPAGPAAHEAATPEQISAIIEQLQHGLDRGALAVGLGPAYTQAATADEILQVFEVAATNKASCHVHLRDGRDRLNGLQEVLADAAVSGAVLHVVHIQSTGLQTPTWRSSIRGGFKIEPRTSSRRRHRKECATF